MKNKIFGGLLIAALAITSVAQAQTKAALHIKDHKERKIEHRINKGVRSGEISRAEAQHLRKEDMRIREEKRMAMANGKMTPMERKHIRRQEKRLSRTIRRDEHSNKVRE